MNFWIENRLIGIVFCCHIGNLGLNLAYTKDWGGLREGDCSPPLPPPPLFSSSCVAQQLDPKKNMQLIQFEHVFIEKLCIN